MNHDNLKERDTAYTQVRELILTRQLAPGAAISERGLSEQLGLGRTPVREAVKTLAQEGLLEAIPARGTFVRQLTMQDLREIHEVRLGLEGIAAVLAAQHGATAALQASARELQALAAQDTLDVLPTQQAGWRFHEAMFDATGNPRLVALYHQLRAQSGLALQQVDDYDAERLRLALREHLDIYDAIAAREPERAQRCIWNHLTQALQGRLQLLVRQPVALV
ncbi:MAG: GntR family transcriptional regulator [Proteobacteria bacterium]|nr:GntR family transcriptional regulator [Pseudomonadota bacterium]